MTLSIQALLASASIRDWSHNSVSGGIPSLTDKLI